MKITNHKNLPDVFARFEEANAHTTEGAKYSVTTLIDSPRVHALQKFHDSEIELDISDRLDAIWGTAIHKVLEQGHDPETQVVEQRFHAKYFGVDVSGQIDMQTQQEDGVLLTDWKSSGTDTVRYNPSGKPEWTNQLNCYAALARANDIKIAGLEVILIMRDWKRSKFQRSQHGSLYPSAPVARYKVPMWKPKDADLYLTQRVALHENYNGEACTEKEMWSQATHYAVYKYRPKLRYKARTLRARATRLFNNEFEADLYAMENDGVVKKRPGSRTRCEGNWCQVNQYCSFYKDYKNNKREELNLGLRTTGKKIYG